MNGFQIGLGALSAVVLTGCTSLPSTSNENAVASSLRLKTSDLSGLGGSNYQGALTYRDYSSDKLVSLDVLANVTVKLDCLTMNLQYPDEPNANSSDEVCISDDGSELGGAPIIALQRLGPDFVAVQTQTAGEDNNKPALIRQNYILSTTAITAGKEVSFDDGETWIERNELDIERQ